MKLSWLFGMIIMLGLVTCKSDDIKDSPDRSEDTKTEIEPNDGSENVETQPVFMAEYNEVIDINKIDQELLDYLVMNGINDVRENKGYKPLQLSGVLVAAAKNQTEYQIKMDNLSHHQNKENVRTAMDRVKYYGGDYRSVGENVQFQGFTIRSFNNKQEIITPSYQKAADDIVQGWVDSPGHYKNLISSEFTYVGTSIIYSPLKKALFATQVYGGF